MVAVPEWATLGEGLYKVGASRGESSSVASFEIH